jgi:hypothetical protein
MAGSTGNCSPFLQELKTTVRKTKMAKTGKPERMMQRWKIGF